MDNTFDSIYIINKSKYNEFVSESARLCIAAYTVPAFVSPEIYAMVDLQKDIAMRVVWKPETTVAQIKEFDKVWFFQKYE